MHLANADIRSHVEAPRQLCRNSSCTTVDVIDAIYVGGLKGWGVFIVDQYDQCPLMITTISRKFRCQIEGNVDLDVWEIKDPGFECRVKLA